MQFITRLTTLTIAFMGIAACAHTSSTHVDDSIKVREAIVVLKQCRPLRELMLPLRGQTSRLSEIIVTARPNWRKSYINYVVDIAKSKGMTDVNIDGLRIALVGGLYAEAVNTVTLAGLQPSGEKLLADILGDLTAYLVATGYSHSETNSIIQTLQAIYPNDQRGQCTI